MKPSNENPINLKRGHLVKFHTPFHDEDPKELYLLLEVFESNDIYKTRADILALGTGFSFPPISKVNLEDLEVVEWDTAELLGYYGTVLKEDGLKVSGKIIQILNEEHKNEPLEILKIQSILRDEKNVEHIGQLLMDSLR